MSKIQETTVSEALALLAQIPEFDPVDPSGGTWEESARRRITGRHVALEAIGISGKPVGALIAYERYKPSTLYCWLAGVLPSARRQGALRDLMNVMKSWAADRGFGTIEIGTKNRFRAMFTYLIKDGYMLLYAEPGETENLADYSLHLMKNLKES